jgi:N-acetylglutamate synthase-like GNAT family acetyltransferase
VTEEETKDTTSINGVKISFRSALPQEAPVIRRLIFENSLNPFGLNLKNFIVAADEQDQLIGCGQIKQHADVEELASLVVVKEWQGRGVSNLLMEKLIKRGHSSLWLMCESSLIPYYKKFSFSEENNPANLPASLRTVYWFSRVPMGLIFLIRGSYLAFMVRHVEAGSA